MLNKSSSSFIIHHSSFEMKRCPTCQKTFEDSMKFCQTDGTPLVSDAAGAGGSSASEPEFDPMKTVIGSPLPTDAPPPSPFGSPANAPRNPSQDLNSPSFGDLGGSSPQASEPLSGGFSDASRSSTPSFQEPEPQFGQNFGQQPFGSTPSDWSPPPVPSANWGNQGLGQNTPFSPPPIGGAGGQNQTMAIISLISGILSCLCCVSIVTGPLGLILGYVAKNNIKQNPSVYGGEKLATWGIITGGIGTGLVVVLIILQVLFGVLSNVR